MLRKKSYEAVVSDCHNNLIMDAEAVLTRLFENYCHKHAKLNKKIEAGEYTQNSDASPRWHLFASHKRKISIEECNLIHHLYKKLATLKKIDGDAVQALIGTEKISALSSGMVQNLIMPAMEKPESEERPAPIFQASEPITDNVVNVILLSLNRYVSVENCSYDLKKLLNIFFSFYEAYGFLLSEPLREHLEIVPKWQVFFKKEMNSVITKITKIREYRSNIEIRTSELATLCLRIERLANAGLINSTLYPKIIPFLLSTLKLSTVINENLICSSINSLMALKPQLSESDLQAISEIIQSFWTQCAEKRSVKTQHEEGGRLWEAFRDVFQPDVHKKLSELIPGLLQRYLIFLNNNPSEFSDSIKVMETFRAYLNKEQRQWVEDKCLRRFTLDFNWNYFNWLSTDDQLRLISRFLDEHDIFLDKHDIKERIFKLKTLPALLETNLFQKYGTQIFEFIYESLTSLAPSHELTRTAISVLSEILAWVPIEISSRNCLALLLFPYRKLPGKATPVPLTIRDCIPRERQSLFCEYLQNNAQAFDDSSNVYECMVNNILERLGARPIDPTFALSILTGALHDKEPMKTVEYNRCVLTEGANASSILKNFVAQQPEVSRLREVASQLCVSALDDNNPYRVEVWILLNNYYRNYLSSVEINVLLARVDEKLAKEFERSKRIIFSNLFGLHRNDLAEFALMNTRMARTTKEGITDGYFPPEIVDHIMQFSRRM